MSARQIIEAAIEPYAGWGLSRIPISTILSIYRPTDLLDGAPRDETRPSALWPYVFATIEREHVSLNPAYWARFQAAVLKRQHTPITVGTYNDGQPCVENGHHRIWALVKAKAASVRAVPG